MNSKIYVFPDAVEIIDMADEVATTGVRGEKFVVRWRKMTPYVLVSAVSGTAPTLDISIEARYAGRWIAIYTFPQITAIGNYRQAPIEIVEYRIRYSISVGGTAPSFTITLGAIFKS